VGAVAADKADTFTVTATDGYGGSVAIPVSVSIAPVNAKPVAGTPTVGTPNASTGVVTGTVAATDADKDTLTFSAPASTAKGAVAINAGNGAFTYTPTATARQNAGRDGATAADRADTFTVTVTDGYGGTTAVPVNVTVSPIKTEQGPTVGINETRFGSYVPEGNSGSKVVPVAVELSRASDQQVTVTYSVSQEGSSSSATPAEDFLAQTGSLVFAPGQTQASIPVTIYGDTAYEGDEYVRIDLTGATNAILVTSGAEPGRSKYGYVTIQNDDSASANRVPVAAAPVVGIPNVSTGWSADQ
jgi:VCBS repeat-containing protein